MMWSAAEAACIGGGHDGLATVLTPNDNDDLILSVDDVTSVAGGPGQFWIGYCNSGSGWSWSSGIPGNYTAWYPGEPNNTGDGDVCAHWYQGSYWGDIPVAWTNPGTEGFICESR